MSFVALLLALLACEIALIILVRRLRRDFQWLITEADELPALDPAAVRKFAAGSFDADLGWVRRLNTTGVEKGRTRNITFHIDAAGARANSGSEGPAVIAAFGDSYVFCRQVEDHETWESQLSQLTGLGVMNFGVGNYGADQALLRYEKTALPATVTVAILGFVPETICRVQSCWKHYLEFGNTLAFKPRFVLTRDGALVLKENVVRSEEDFSNLSDKLPEIRAADEFYRRKFRSLQFRTPYLVSFFRHPLRNGKLIGALILRAAARLIGRESPWLENLPFILVLAANIRDAHRMYDEPAASALLRAVLLRFKDVAEKRGHMPVVLVMPQLLDLKASRRQRESYRRFFDGLRADMAVLDVTGRFLGADPERFYIDDQYGGHFSAEGNRVVAQEVGEYLRGRSMDGRTGG